ELDIHGVTRKIELPLVTAVLADLSGKPADPLPPVSDRTFVDVDEASFDAFMAATRPRAAFLVPNTLTGAGNLAVELTFESLADFAPGAVARKIEPLQALLAERGQTAGGAGEIDRRISEQLNLILHTAEFQRLE